MIDGGCLGWRGILASLDIGDANTRICIFMTGHIMKKYCFKTRRDGVSAQGFLQELLVEAVLIPLP